MEEFEAVVESKRGSGTILRRRLLPKGPCRGKVLMLHGLGDHSGTHLPNARLLAASGYETHAFDWPGHGGSSGWRGDIPDLADAYHLIDEALGIFGTSPAGIYAHSTGAFLYLRYLQWKNAEQQAPTIPWLWLSSPLLRPGHNQSTLKKKLAKVIAKVAPRAPLTTGVTRAQVCHVEHPDVASAKRDFEGCHTLVSARFGFSLLQAEESVMKSAELLPRTTKLFLAQGDDDRICPSQFAIDYFGRATCQSKTLLFVKGARHEIFRESIREVYFGAARSWLREM